MHHVRGTGTVVWAQWVRDVQINVGTICTGCGVDEGVAGWYRDGAVRRLLPGGQARGRGSDGSRPGPGIFARAARAPARGRSRERRFAKGRIEWRGGKGMRKGDRTEISVLLNFSIPEPSKAAILGRVSAAVLGAVTNATPITSMLVRAPKLTKSGGYLVQIDRVVGVVGQE